MKLIINAAADYPRWFLLAIGLVTILAITQLDKLRVSISAESLLDRDTPAWEFLKQTEATFGSDTITIVFLHDPELFTPEKLRAVREVVRAIGKLPFVTQTNSLFSARNVKSINGEISTKPYLGVIPETAEAAQAVKADALINPLLINNLISADGRTLAINVVTEPDPGDPAFDQTATTAIEHIIEPLRERLDSVFQIGSPAVRNALTEKIRSDQRLLLPLSLLVLLFTLAISLRRMSAALIPLCTAGLSVIWTLGFMGFLEIHVNIMTSIVPALIIVIGSTEDIHLLAEYTTGIRQGKTRSAAIRFMADKVGLTVFLTFITTYVGFLSVSLNDIELLYQFGLIASSGLLFNFLITVVLVPILLNLFGERTAPKDEPRTSVTSLYQRVALALLALVRKHRIVSLVTIALITVLSFVGAQGLTVNNNPMDYLEEQSPIRNYAEQVHQELAGMHTFSIVVDTGIDETFLHVKYLEELKKIQRKLSEMKIFDRSLSFADFISFVNWVMEDDPVVAVPDLPYSDDIVQEYMLFIDHEDVQQYLSDDFSSARIMVRHNIGSSQQLNDAIEELRAFIAEKIDPALRVTFTGTSILSNQAVDGMARGQFLSLLLVGGVIIVIVSLLFVNVRAGLVALFPNLFTVFVLFGVMGFTGIPLDAGTSMVAAIALGICVDDTIHAMSRFHQELKEKRHRDEAIEAMIQAEAVPIFTTSIALAAGFGIFAFSSFIPVAHFGLLSTMVILLALVATFFITPTFFLTPLLLGSAGMITAWELLSYKVRDEYVRKCPLFLGMSIWQIKKVLLTSEIRRYEIGQKILEEGSVGKEMFVVLEGRVDASKTDREGEVKILREIGTGEIFGEVAAFAGGKRTADILAATETEVLVLSWRRIERIASLFPFIGTHLFRNLSRVLGQKLVETQEYSIEKDATP